MSLAVPDVRRLRQRARRFLRRPTVRVIGALIAAFLLWVCFSVGQALAAPGGGSTSTKLAEWARDHYLGPVVTFGEWLTYQPPAKGGNPSFNMSVPKGAGAGDPAKRAARRPGSSRSSRRRCPRWPARRCPVRASGGCWRP